MSKNRYRAIRVKRHDDDQGLPEWLYWNETNNGWMGNYREASRLTKRRANEIKDSETLTGYIVIVDRIGKKAPMKLHKWSDIKNKTPTDRKAKIDKKVKKVLNKMPPIKPGEILLKGFIIPAFSKSDCPDVSYKDLCGVLTGTKKITKKIAHELAEACGTTDEFWLNLQKDYDSKKE